MQTFQGTALVLVVVVTCAGRVAGQAKAETQETVASDKDFGMGLMLFGCMIFSLASFYLVKSGDGDLELFAWKMLHSTVSIFNAIAIFQVMNELIKVFAESLPVWIKLLIDVAHMLAWYTALQALMAWVSGAVGSKKAEGELKEMHLVKKKVEQNMHCFAGLLGHITGFAAIKALSTLQQLCYQSAQTWTGDESCLPMMIAISIVISAGFLLHMLNKITNVVRSYVALRDGLLDWFEKKWTEEVQETEDDVMGLAISFLAVQVLKAVICGSFPNEDGEDREDAKYSAIQISMLMGTAVLCACLLIVALHTASYLHRKFHMHSNHSRLYSGIFNIICMLFAWCLLWSIDWIVPLMDGQVEKLVLAVINTVVVFLCIFCLDKLADRDWTSKRVDKALRDLMQAFGVLMGFSWEQCFDYTWKSTVDHAPYSIMRHPLINKVLLSGVMFIIIVPAWYWYVVPTVLRLEEITREKATPKSNNEEPLLDDDAIPYARNLEKQLNRVFENLQDSQNRVRQLEECIERMMRFQPVQMVHGKQVVWAHSKLPSPGSIYPVPLARAAQATQFVCNGDAAGRACTSTKICTGIQTTAGH